MKALFIGRFQPFHKGHLKAIKYLFNKYDGIIIGVGSSQYSNTVENPFSSDERMLMIRESLKQEKIYLIILNTVKEAKNAITDYITFYNSKRMHQSLEYLTPEQVYLTKIIS